MRRRGYPESNLVLARLLEAQGDFHSAQRRTPQNLAWSDEFWRAIAKTQSSYA